MKKLFFIITSFVFLLVPFFAAAGTNAIPSIAGIRLEFILFALTLVGVAVFHNKTFWVAIIGLASVLIFKFILTRIFMLESIFSVVTIL
jgi:hypothetical protein